MECPDFSEFQDSLNKMRTLDDKLIYALNATIPTDSFKETVDPTLKCQDLFSKIQSGHSQREISIKKCILATADSVKKLKEVKESDSSLENIKNLKAVQTKLRLLQSELSVEEVIKERTMKVFNEKCRNYYKPTKL